MDISTLNRNCMLPHFHLMNFNEINDKDFNWARNWGEYFNYRQKFGSIIMKNAIKKTFPNFQLISSKVFKYQL